MSETSPRGRSPRGTSFGPRGVARETAPSKPIGDAPQARATQGPFAGTAELDTLPSGARRSWALLLILGPVAGLALGFVAGLWVAQATYTAALPPESVGLDGAGQTSLSARERNDSASVGQPHPDDPTRNEDGSKDVELREIVDGDTFRVMFRPSKPQLTGVRLLNVDTPEIKKSEPLALEARDALERMLDGRTLRVAFRDPDRTDTDVFGRLLAYVYADDVFVNLELVRLGYSRYDTRFGPASFPELFRAAEREAIAAKRGIWGLPNPPASWPLNVNRATPEQLTSVPGIGPALAARIVANREAHGPFRTLHDLTRVQGIGENTILDWGDYLAMD